MRVSFVIPVYNERETLEALTEGILEHVRPHEPHIVFIDDGSTDGSTEILRRLRDRYPVIEVIRFRRNFGKSAALAAGFDRADGDFVFTMDADLQDDPAEIPRFLEKIEEGCDIVVGWKAKRRDPWHKTLPSRVYNRAVSRLFGLGLHDINCGFKLYRTEVVKRLRVYGEMHRLLPALALGLGYRSEEIPVTHHPRRYGVSKYGFERFAKGAVDVLTVWFLIRHSYTPAHFFGKGAGALAGTAILALVAGAAFAAAGRNLAGATAWLTALMLLLGAGASVALGLVAELFLRHRVRIDPALYIDEEGFPEGRNGD